MKKISTAVSFKLLALSFFVILSTACDVYPQTVNVKVTYTVPAAVDSCKLLIWKGTNTANNPLFEDGDYNALNLAGLTVINIPAVNGEFTRQFNADGETFKLALVVFDTSIPSDLTVSAFYILPIKPAKAQFIDVEISVN